MLSDCVDCSKDTVQNSIICNGISHESSENTGDLKLSEPQLYTRRWYILFLFFNANFANSLQWIQFSTITNTIQQYYNASIVAVNWLNQLFYLSYVVFGIPATFFLYKKGLRWTMLLGTIGTAVGGWIKVVAVSPELFYLAFIGQTISAVAECFVFGLNSEVAARWFGAKEVTTADAIGVLGSTASAAIAFLIPLAVGELHDVSTTTHEMKWVFYVISIHATITAMLIIVYFPDGPPNPPSKANASALKNERNKCYTKSIKAMLTNYNYILILFVYAVTSTYGSTVLSLISQIVNNRFPDSNKVTSIAGILLSAIGFFGSAAVSVYLGRTHRYRATAIVLSIGGIIAGLGFIFSIHYENIISLYITCAAIGFFGTAFYTFGYDYGAEIAYPESEGISGILLSLISSISGFSMISLCEWMLTSYGDVACNLFNLSTLIVAIFVLFLLKPKLRRQEIEATKTDADAIDNSIMTQFSEVDSNIVHSESVEYCSTDSNA